MYGKVTLLTSTKSLEGIARVENGKLCVFAVMLPHESVIMSSPDGLGGNRTEWSTSWSLHTAKPQHISFT